MKYETEAELGFACRGLSLYAPASAFQVCPFFWIAAEQQNSR
jgi:hypothetical protein